MNIEYEDGKLILFSENQSVAFHTRRERNAVGENNDIIYVTLPLYSFNLVFYPDGKMVGSAEKSGTLEEVWEGSGRISYGHPHTRHSSSSRTFASVCTGNNRFIQDWSAMRHGGIMDGNNTLRILSQAAIWMETANISDMYGTYLAHGPHIPENELRGIDVDGLFHNRVPIGAGAPTLRFIYDTYGEHVYRMALWPLWMWRHFHDLPTCLTSCVSMYQAALLDSWIILKHPETFGAMYEMSGAEIARALPVSLRCYRELGGYYPYSSHMEMTLAQSMPEMFPENSNYMEANNVTSGNIATSAVQTGSNSGIDISGVIENINRDSQNISLETV